VLATHALGFPLRTAIPLGEAFVEAIASMLVDLGGLLWYPAMIIGDRVADKLPVKVIRIGALLS
jgi:hypothetical protein